MKKLFVLSLILAGSYGAASLAHAQTPFDYTVTFDNADPTFTLPSSGTTTDYLTGTISYSSSGSFQNDSLIDPSDTNGDTLSFNYVGPTGSFSSYSGNILSLTLTPTATGGIYSGGELLVSGISSSRGPGGGIVFPAASNGGTAFGAVIAAPGGDQVSAPEPSTWALLVFGAGALAIHLARRPCAQG